MMTSHEEKTDICQKLWAVDFVTPSSWNLFFSLGFKKIDLPWLQCHPDEWAMYDSYKEFEQVGANIVCTNDVAERAIKLVQVRYYSTVNLVKDILKKE